MFMWEGTKVVFSGLGIWAWSWWRVLTVVSVLVIISSQPTTTRASRTKTKFQRIYFMTDGATTADNLENETLEQDLGFKNKEGGLHRYIHILRR